MYSVSQQEEVKFEKMIALENYICIINAWKKELQGDNTKMEQYRNLKKIELLLDNNLFERLSKRGKLNHEWKDSKLFKKGPKNSGLVSLHEQVKSKYSDYRQANFNCQRQMLSDIYYREIWLAIAND